MANHRSTTMRIPATAFLSLLVFANVAPAGDPGTALVPKPVELKTTSGSFRITHQTVILHDGASADLARLLQQDLAVHARLKIRLATNAPNRAASIRIRSAPAGKSDLGEYTLTVAPTGVTIQAPTPAGRFYATRTLLQLLAAAPRTIPCVEIHDHARFRWRGLMIDCSRTFWRKEFIKRTIRLMSLYKLNRLHLHLTDDQGWRLEIKKYPKLTRLGARFPEKYKEPPERQGFYTQEDMKEIIAYAARYHVTIIPEIEMPGHCLAALACFPELSCTGGPFEIHPFFKGPNIHKEIFCAGNEKTFEFLENVLSEVCELFPSEIIHIGGDEAPKASWRACPKCQERKRREGLKSDHALQDYFVQRIETFLKKKGKRLIGWNEIYNEELDPGSLLMAWRTKKKDVALRTAALKAGHDVVLTPTSHCYFDYKYERISTLKVHSFEPFLKGLGDKETAHILGVQANFWSHIDRVEDGVDKQLFPRLLALAEINWSSKERNRDCFIRRAGAQLVRLKELGVHYYQDPALSP